MREPLFTSNDPDLPLQLLGQWNNREMLNHFGLRLEFPDDHTVRAVLDNVGPHQRGGMQSTAVNGGVLSAMLDLVLGMPGVTRAPAQPSGTMQLNINFVRAVRTDSVTAEGWITRAGRGILFNGAHVLDGDGKVCATATGIVRVIT